jgi:spore coat polysaccharide biosynthesis protein SpsF
MNSDVFIPIRLSNTRLPKKALKEINGIPVVKYLIERIKKAKKIRNVIICTTKNKIDDELVEFLEKENYMFYRGSESDILIRYLHAAENFGTDFIVSVDGDDIYSDPSYVDKMISAYEKTNADYVDMVNFPFGIASVGIKREALVKVCKLKKTDNTETGYRLFFQDKKIFKIHKMEPEENIKFPKELRLTLDYQEDLDLAKKIIFKLTNDFHLEDIIELFKKSPELLQITDNLEERYKQHWDKNVADTQLKDIHTE